MKTSTIHRRPLARARFTSIHAMAAAALVLGGLGTATSRAGILYVATDGPYKIETFTHGGVGSVFAANSGPKDTSVLGSPQGLAFDSAGNLYVANANGGSANTIKRFTPGGVMSLFASDPGDHSVLSGPSGLAFDSAGNLYAANFGTNTIERFTPDGVGSVFATDGSLLLRPTGLAFDSKGNLYVANYGGNTIAMFTPDGAGSLFASDSLSNPFGLAFDGAGNLYVSNSGSNTIEEFTPEGAGSLFASGLNRPLGLAFDSAGNLYVANQNSNRIEEFTPGGVGSVFASSGAPTPTFLAFAPDLAPVPEPGTALFGVALVGIAGVRRRRAAAV